MTISDVGRRLACGVALAWGMSGCAAPHVPAGGIGILPVTWSVAASGVARFELQQAGETLSGVYEEGSPDSAVHNRSSISGTVKGNKVTFSFFRQGNGEEGRGVACLFSGTLDAATHTMKGHATLGTFETVVTWTAALTRQP